MPPRKIERNTEILQRIANGETQKQIAKDYGIGLQRVSQIVRAERAKMPLRARDEVIRDMAAQLDHMRDMAEAIVHSDVPPAMSAGQPVPMRDDDGTVIEGRYAADYSAHLAAMETIVKIQHREANLLGLNAPTHAVLEGAMTIEMKGVEDV